MNSRFHQISAVAGAIALLAIAGFWWTRQQSSKEAAAIPATKSVSRTEKEHTEPEISPAVAEKPQASLIENSPKVEAAAAPLQSAAAGSHGTDCAHCLAETKLVACRADYAQMRYQQLSADIELNEAQSTQLRDACRKLADEAVREWSFAESRPVMVPDAVLQQQEKQYIEPVMASITARK